MLCKVLYKQSSNVVFNNHANLKMGLQKYSGQDLNLGVFVVHFQQILSLSKKKYNPQIISVTLAFLSLMPSINKKQEHDQEEMSVFKI